MSRERRYEVYRAERSEAIDFAWRWAVIDTWLRDGGKHYPIIAWCAKMRDAKLLADAATKAERRSEVIAAGMGRNPMRARPTKEAK